MNAGTCLCGTVGIRTTVEPLKVGHCHCDNCRRAHGAAYWTWATFPASALEITTGNDCLGEFIVAEGSRRRFCRNCGTTMLYDSPRWPGLVDVSVANLRDPVPMPDRRVYADRAPAWSPITDDLPRFGGPDGVTPL